MRGVAVETHVFFSFLWLPTGRNRFYTVIYGVPSFIKLDLASESKEWPCRIHNLHAQLCPLTSHFYRHSSYLLYIFSYCMEPSPSCSCTVQYLPTSRGPYVLNGIFPIPTVHLQGPHLRF